MRLTLGIVGFGVNYVVTIGSRTNHPLIKYRPLAYNLSSNDCNLTIILSNANVLFRKLSTFLTMCAVMDST